MKYTRFEDLPVWQAGIDLTVKAFELTEDKAFRFKGDIANQLQRAALSVPNNIAEGFDRGTNADLLTFLYYAKGSAGEVRSILHVIARMPAFGHLKPAADHLLALATSIGRQLGAWADSIQNSDLKGRRYVTDQGRQAKAGEERRDAFLADIRAVNEETARRREETRRRQVAADSEPRTPDSGGRP
jgi:four helix bundle protein